MAENHDQALKKPDDSLLPHLESLERMMKLPVMEAAWTSGQGYYEKARGEFLARDFESQRKRENEVHESSFTCVTIAGACFVTL